jgi:ubiquinone/menaquinone biosynthesis C-methylase UbiE
MIDTEDENIVGKFYDEYSPVLQNWANFEKTLSIHYGYFQKGTITNKQAILNMNDFVAELLNLNKKEKLMVLDAGCGVGGTSIYLAKKYPNIEFTGITIAPGQVELAKNYSKKRNASNTKFMVTDYLKTNFPDNNFDKIFALESFVYAKDPQAFINEMYRILKPGGNLAVIDCFKRKKKLNPTMQKIYRQFTIEFGYAKPTEINSFKEDLKNNGFSNVKVKDISRNVGVSVFFTSLYSTPVFVSKMIKRALKFGKLKVTDNLVGYSRGATVLGGIVGLSGVIGYFATSCVKE